MTWIPDLRRMRHPAFPDAPFYAVGWLETGHPYDIGRFAEDDRRKLRELLVDPWQPWLSGGGHRCSLCSVSDRVRYNDQEVVGGSNLFLPAAPKIYVAPSLLVHYIDAHGYKPPDEFIDALRACPPMSSWEYKRALLAAGGVTLLPTRLR